MGTGGETSQTLDRGIRLLQHVAGSGAAGLTVTELAGQLGVGRPVVYRLVATLLSHDLVRRQDDGRVRLGAGVMQLAAAIYPGIGQVARPILRTLADAAGATSHLTVAEGEEAVALAVVEPSWSDFHVTYRVGSRHPLERGAAGKAIAAGRRGAAAAVVTRGELQQGASGMAAPVLGVPGLEASVGVITVEVLDEERVAKLVTTAARQVARSLTNVT